MHWNLVLFKMNRVWNGLCYWKDSRAWRKIVELNVRQIGYRHICLHLKHGIFHLCHSWHHFVEGFLQRWCCRQRFRGYLRDFSLLLIDCYIRNWECVHNRGSCILGLNMLSNPSQGSFNKVEVLNLINCCK